MNRERIGALFAQALDLPESQRADWLAAQCAGDEATRAEVERLLRADAEVGDFIERSPGLVADAAAAARGSGAPSAFGAWRVLRSIGIGGMGEVWLAERGDDEFEQRVAVKQLAYPTPRLLQRFRQERRILARLEHPHIARLIDGGLDARGIPYLVMEYVEGVPITDYVRERVPELRARLHLFLRVCEAVQYAHQNLVVHRDLKPSNIFVTADGTPKLLDFGIAKVLTTGEADAPTQTLARLLTPDYAAPEQFSGGAITTATDVYALGVVLYELLADARPRRFAPNDAASAEPPPPSTAITRGTGVAASRRRQLRGDLDRIALAAMARDPARRYPSAEALAADIRRHLDGLPIAARPASAGYRLRKFAVRNWLPLSAAGLLFAAMAVATVAVAWQAGKARLAAQRAEAVQGFLVDLFNKNSTGQKDPAEARQTTVRELLDIGAARIEESLDIAPENKLALLRVFSDLYANGLGDGYPSIPLLQQALALSADLYGEDSVESASDRMRLARPLMEQGKSAEAKALLQAAAGTLDRRGDRTSELRGRLHAAQAYAFLDQDRRRAREEADAAVAVLRKHPPSRDLVRALIYQGWSADGQAAMESLQEAIRVSRAVDGDRDPMLMSAYASLAKLQRNVRDYAAAESAAREALDLSLKDRSEFNYDRTRAMSNIASIQFSGGRIKESLQSARLAKEWLAGPAGGSDNPAISADVLRTLAVTLGAAGEFDDALAEASAAVKILRETTSDSRLAPALLVAAYRLAELGRLPEASAALEEARAIRERTKSASSNGHVPTQIHMALDFGNAQQARVLLEEYPRGDAVGREAEFVSFHRTVLEAEIELQGGDPVKSARLASTLGERMRASDIARYLRPVIADSDLIEGLARLRTGDAAAARPILERALAARIDLYLPKSPRIAEVQLALAECALAQEKRAEAMQWVEQAAAIQAQHSSLSPRYTAPLQRLRERLAQR